MKLKVLSAAIAVSLLAPGLAHAQLGKANSHTSNFYYNTIGIDLGRVTLDDKLVIEDEVYDGFGSATLEGGVQLADNLALYALGDYFTNDGSRTEATYTALEAGIKFPIPIGDRFDIIPSLGYQNAEIEVCIDGTCASEDESILVYGAGARFWVIPDQMEFSIGYKDSSDSDYDHEISVGIFGWIEKHHRLGIEYMTEKELSRATLGYRYVF